MKCVVLAIVRSGLSAGAVYTPYVSNDDSSCTDPALPSPALVYACQKRQAIKGQRAEVIETQNGVASALIPLAGFVGYKAACGGSQNSVTALAATGVAGYGLWYLSRRRRLESHIDSPIRLIGRLSSSGRSASALGLPALGARHQWCKKWRNLKRLEEA